MPEAVFEALGLTKVYTGEIEVRALAGAVGGTIVVRGPPHLLGGSTG